MSGFARDQVAIVGYAHSAVQRHADRSLGVLTLDTARHAIADAGLAGRRRRRLRHLGALPDRRRPRHRRRRQHRDGRLAGLAPRRRSGLRLRVPGHGPDPRDRGHGRQRHHQRRRQPRARPPGPAQPAGPLPRQLAAHDPGPQQWTAPQGFFGPVSAMIGLTYNEYLQRYGASREAMAAVVVEARKNGARLPVVGVAGQAHHRRGLPGRPDDQRPDRAPRLRHARRRRRRLRPHLRRAGPRPPATPGVHLGLRQLGAAPPSAATALAARRRHGQRPTSSSTGCGRAAASAPTTSTFPRSTTASRHSSTSGSRCSGLCPVGEAHRFVQDGRIDSDRPDGLPVLSGGGALGNGRMHGIPQMLECYLQVSRTSRRPPARRRRRRAGLRVVPPHGRGGRVPQGAGLSSAPGSLPNYASIVIK